MSAAAKGNADRRLVLWLCGGMLVLIALVAFFAPTPHEEDVTPTTYNSGAHGTKAAFLLLPSLGYAVTRSDQSTAATLDSADAPHTTYILAGPDAPSEPTQKAEYAAVERFLRRGGRVVATGFAGAYYLPGGRTGEPTQMFSDLCTTVPEGQSVYAAAGPISAYDQAPWSSEEPAVRVDARCGRDAVIVHRPYSNGGEFVWFSSAEAINNRALARDNNLRMLLAAVGPTSRHVIFDEFHHGEESSPSDYLQGLPLHSLYVQAALLAALLLFSFSRRSGPLREPVRIPRSSPVEFAENMGALYERAGATQPATEAARRRLLGTLVQTCGIPAETTQKASSQELATQVGDRFRVDPAPLATLLDRSAAARYERLRPREALALVRDIDAEIDRLESAANPSVVNDSFTKLTV